MSDPIKIKFGKPGVLPTEPGMYFMSHSMSENEIPILVEVVKTARGMMLIARDCGTAKCYILAKDHYVSTQPLTFEAAEL